MTPAQRAVLTHPAFRGRIDLGSLDECWLWTAGQANGYGRVRWAGKTWWAHRLARFVGYGDLPEAICHTCDVKRCVNPDHCRPGTLVENAHEMWDRGFGRPIPILSRDQVLMVHARYATAHHRRGLARTMAAEFSVSVRTIYRAIDGSTKAYRAAKTAVA